MKQINPCISLDIQENIIKQVKEINCAKHEHGNRSN
jgi:hypothetical protein